MYTNKNDNQEHSSPIKEQKSLLTISMQGIFSLFAGKSYDKQKGLTEEQQYQLFNVDTNSVHVNNEIATDVKNPDIILEEPLDVQPVLKKDDWQELINLQEQEIDRGPVKSNKKGIGAIIAIITIILWKAKGFGILLLTKLLPFLVHLKTLFVTAGSMLATILIYIPIYTWKVAVGFVLLIFVHEMGHALMMRLRGIKAGAPVFIPFVGAFISMKDMPKNAVTEAEIALGGPLLGTVGAIAMFAMYLVTGVSLWLFLAYLGFFINLFNLTPVSPLDGGRAVTAISTKLWILGLVILAIETFIFFNPLLLIILIVGVVSYFSGKDMRKDFNQQYYNVHWSEKLIISLLYFGLLIFLGFATIQSHNMLAQLKI